MLSSSISTTKAAAFAEAARRLIRAKTVSSWAPAKFSICAYAAYWLANHKGKVFGDDREGFITIPIIDENEVRDGKSMEIKVYNKLIRDKIPQIIEDSGKKAIIENVSGSV